MFNLVSIFLSFFLISACNENGFKSSPQTKSTRNDGELNPSFGPESSDGPAPGPGQPGFDPTLPNPGPIGIPENPVNPEDCHTSTASTLGTQFQTTELNFENSPATDGMVVDATLNQHFSDVFGVSLHPLVGGDLKLAKIVRQGESRVQFRAWGSVMCPGLPNHNRLCDSSSQTAAGRWAVSTSNSMSSKNIEFEIRYKVPVKELSFDIIDIDGNESWSIQPYDANGDAVGSPVTLESMGYNVGASTNSQTKRFEVKSPVKNIMRVKLTGRKNINIFGFGFDNFTTGVDICP